MLLAHTGDPDSRTTMSDAILDGYAPDGELYVPIEYPTLSDRELYNLRSADYPTIFYEVTKKFLYGVIPDDELRRTATEAYSPQLFDFDEGSLRLNETSSGIYIAGLSDGPTGAFKDMAMQPFARWVEAIRKTKGIEETLNLLISTSGDTGPAAQHAFGSVQGVHSFTMFPQGKGASEFQRAQMIGMHNGENVHSLEVAADFTDINNMHMQLEERFEVGAVNSVNIARLIAQVPYHVATYLQTIEASGGIFGDEVDITIPSGNFGNGLAAIIARKMGVPIRNIIIATNENNTLSRFFNEGVYPNVPKEDEKQTTSSAQDIRNASNWWRLAHMLYGGRNPEIYKQWKEQGDVDLTHAKITSGEYLRGIRATTIDELARHAMMMTVWESSNGRTMIDPHTANAVVAAERFKDRRGVPMAAYETAKPFKFPATVQHVLGVKAVNSERFKDVMSIAEGKTVPHFDTEAEIAEYLAQHSVSQKAS